MIKNTMHVEANDARLVAVLTVKIIFQEPNQQITAPIATQNSTESIVNAIILTRNSAKRTKPASIAKLSTW